MQVGKLIAVWLPIALGIVMIGAGAVNFVGPWIGPRLLRALGLSGRFSSGDGRARGDRRIASADPSYVACTSRAGAIGSAAVLLAAVMTLIRHRDWTHLPGAVVLTAVAVTIRG